MHSAGLPGYADEAGMDVPLVDERSTAAFRVTASHSPHQRAARMPPEAIFFCAAAGRRTPADAPLSTSLRVRAGSL